MFTGFIAVLGLAFRGGHMAVAVRGHLRLHRCLLRDPGNVPSVAAERQHEGAELVRVCHRGIMTTGHSSAPEATTLVLLLPFLILMFGIAVVTIASLV